MSRENPYADAPGITGCWGCGKSVWALPGEEDVRCTECGGPPYKTPRSNRVRERELERERDRIDEEIYGP